MALETSVIEAYSTPIISSMWNTDSRKELEEHIKTLATTTAGVNYSNVGGFHSGGNIFENDVPSINALKAVIAELCQCMTNCYHAKGQLNLKIVGWANIMTAGCYHRIHGHPDCHWSGIYYVSVGKTAPPQGHLQFQDPRPGAVRLQLKNIDLAPNYSVSPVPGLIIMFPSYLEHYVHPFFETGERISIAFNVTAFDA